MDGMRMMIFKVLSISNRSVTLHHRHPSGAEIPVMDTVPGRLREAQEDVDHGLTLH